LGWGGYWPWYSGLGWGWGYPYVGDYSYSYPATDGGDTYYYNYYDSAPPSYDYSSNPYSAPNYNYDDSSVVANPGLTAPQPYAESAPTAPATPDGQQQATTGAEEFYSEARAAFLNGDYQSALRLAGHAALDAPRNSKVHELISLALFALGNYTAAANEAHAAMAMGPIADWNDLYGYYNDASKYTTQLRALEKAVSSDPKSAAEHFLLGYHYSMIGARGNAKTQFAQAVKLTPKDKLASHYLEQLQSNAPLEPPQMASRPQGTEL